MISTYAELQTAVGNWSYRTDLTALIPDFITLCEADMQVRCKLTEFEASTTLTLTSGIATLPTGFVGHRAVYWDGDQTRPLKYLPPDRFDASTNLAGLGTYFTITGGTIKVSPLQDGTVVMTYKARFTPLAASNTTNYLLTNYPDAYLHGSLVQMARYTKDSDAMATTMPLYEAAIKRIQSDNMARKYPGPLEVRVS